MLLLLELFSMILFSLVLFFTPQGGFGQDGLELTLYTITKMRYVCKYILKNNRKKDAAESTRVTNRKTLERKKQRKKKSNRQIKQWKESKEWNIKRGCPATSFLTNSEVLFKSYNDHRI